MPSKYIVFEGTDGSGKSTLSTMVADHLPGKVIRTKEPGTPHLSLCVDIRAEILNKDSDKDPLTYAYLFAADTRLHMTQVVRPVLTGGCWVVSDRSVMSDYAYRPKDGNEIRDPNLDMFVGLAPIVFFIDADPDVCTIRMNNREQELNEFEKKHVLGKIRQIRHDYLYLSQGTFNQAVKTSQGGDDGIWYNIDNNGLIEDAFMRIMCILGSHFAEIRNTIYIQGEDI